MPDNVVELRQCEPWPKHHQEVRDAPDDQVRRWRFNNNDEPLEFLLALAIAVEYDRRFPGGK